MSNFKEQADEVWKTLANTEAIFQACQALEAAGENVNRENVARVSGVSSNNILAAGMWLYRERKPLLEASPQTPAALVEAICRAVDREFLAVEQQFQTSLTEEKDAFAAALQASAEAGEVLQADLVGAQQALEQAASEMKEIQLVLSDKQLELQLAQQRGDEFKANYEATLVSNDDLQKTLAQQQKDALAAKEQAEQRMAELQRSAREAKEDLMQQHENALHRLMLEKDQLNTELKQRLKDTQSEAKAALKKAEERQTLLSEQVGEQKAAADALRQAQMETQRELVALESRNTQLQGELHAVAEQRDKHVDAHQKLREQLASLEAKNTALEQQQGFLQGLLERRQTVQETADSKTD